MPYAALINIENFQFRSLKCFENLKLDTFKQFVFNQTLRFLKSKLTNLDFQSDKMMLLLSSSIFIIL